MMITKRSISLAKRYSILIALAIWPLTVASAQEITFTANSVATDNLYVEWNGTDPERVTKINWNSQGLRASEPNLTAVGVLGTNGPCYNGLVEYFGNSWAPPDPHVGGKVLVGAGSSGARVKGPDSKMVINSVSDACGSVSANVAVNTLYKFWRGGEAANKMRVTRSFTFDSAFDLDFRPFIPRFGLEQGFTQVLYPNAAGTALVTENVFACPLGCRRTDWNGDNEAQSWYAFHNSISGQGIVVKRNPNGRPAQLWIDYDGASSTNSSSVILPRPEGGFAGEVTEVQTLCFYDATTWIPTLESLPPGC